MKIIKFKGGLGNQLFQYAFKRYLEVELGHQDVKGDLFYYNKISGDSVRKPRVTQFKIKMDWASQSDISKLFKLRRVGNPLSFIYKFVLFIEKTINRSYYFEPDRGFRAIEEIQDNEYFDGYWQSWRYVDKVKNELKKELQLKSNFGLNTRNAIEQIHQEEAVFISVRRGDYLANKKVARHYGQFSDDYYQQAIKIIESKVSNPVFYIFSNDIEWVKKNVDFGTKVNYRDEVHQVSDVEELMIMSACKHAIIVNSTFHWWGAWMIENKKKVVVAPAHWFADGKPIDIVPSTWIKL